MCAEFIVIGNKPSTPVFVSVMMMVGGALIAAIYDLTFDFHGYLLVFLNNSFTALNGVWMKKASISGKCNKMGILYYNSLFSAIIMILYFVIDHYSVNSLLGDEPIIGVRGSIQNIEKSRKLIEKVQNGPALIPQSIHKLSKISAVWDYPGWTEPDFCFLFICSAFLGTLLNYAIFLCTTINSALTTAVIGCLKNVATTYISMLILPDYIFNNLNFIGLNISIIGSIYYTYITIFKGQTGFGA
jgi:solute carrier family 35 protein